MERHLIRIKPLLIAIFFFILICSNIVAKYIKAINYLDEIITILLFSYFCLHIIVHKLKKVDANIIAIIIVLFILGLLGNFKSGVQNNKLYQLLDAFNVFKFAFTMLGARIVFNNASKKEYVIHYLSSMIKLMILVSTVFMLLNFVSDIGMHTDMRFGLRSYNFIFTRVGNLYSAYLICLMVFTTEEYFFPKKSNRLYIVLTLINICATLRSRALAFSVLYLMLYYLFAIEKDKTFKKRYIIPLIVLFGFIAGDQLEFYFTGRTARAALLINGFTTANTYFPLGSGFATYGTAIARDYYSPLYVQYGFARIYGLSPNYTAFLTDSYWPAIMGEFGYFGIILVVVLIYFVFKRILNDCDNEYSRLCVYFGIGILLISSIASSSFFACSRLIVFMCYFARLSTEDNKQLIMKP